ncbi:MAG: twin-arginine translocation signal domain-containing protein [Planctomycetes bacterium]|nr:twin-arginine translocation signal domain-containing protein [Planctomycetota bacterium]
MSTRRDFLKAAALTSALLAGPNLLAATSRRGDDKMKVLIIGGTRFLGPHTVEALRARGHEVTLFNRGRSNPGLFPDLEQLTGDRRKDLSALDGRRFDAVIDTCGYFPRDLELSTAKLADSGFYCFVSTVSVYKSADDEDTDESSELLSLEHPEAEKRITNENYGALKNHCEQAAMKGMPGKCVNVRPGLIVGPRDETDRFTYWPARIARGGRVLAPGKPDWGTQYIDVRDLAAFIVRLCERKTTGHLNAIGPAKPTPMGDLLAACKKAARSEAEIVWADADWLAAQGVQAWGEMPLYMGKPKGDRPAIVSNVKAVAAGLGYRGLDDTVSATLAYHLSLGADRKLRAGIDPDKEAKVLAAWDAKLKSEQGAK